mmetsp:Transcript_16711/g.24545  ORF Transcript_16711/g.24545 Transcript_16711/m.24545 type:complete len:105 (-) Transcript_16711:423-737(-)
MVRAARSLCFTSRYEEGSSNMYTSASCTTTTPMANLCSSPPDKTSTSLSRRCISSISCRVFSITSLWLLLFMMTSTFPCTARGMWSTYWGLMIAFRLSSRMRVK